MGSNSSKTTKIERRERNELRGAKINDNINNIRQFEQKIIESAQTNVVNTTDIVNIDDLKTYLDITNSATQQLMRDGKPFTKKDLIAIITALHPGQIAHIKTLDSLTVADLISMIRCIIYDMNRYMNYQNSNQTQQQEYQSTDLTIMQNAIEDRKMTKTKPLRITDSNKTANQLVIKKPSNI